MSQAWCKCVSKKLGAVQRDFGIGATSEGAGTGWVQVNGKNKLNWAQRMEYDIRRVQYWSLRLD